MKWMKVHRLTTLALCFLLFGSSRDLLSSQQGQAASGWLSAIKGKFDTTRLAGAAFLREETLKKLNAVIPNFSQNLRTTKKTLEISLHYITTIMKKLDIPETMTLYEVNANIAHIEAAMKKIDEQKRKLHPVNPQQIDLMSREQVQAAVKSGDLRITDLSTEQIRKFYGPVEEVD